MIHGMRSAGVWHDRRGTNLLDGGAPFYGVYATADDGHMAVGALEQRFYDEFTGLLGLPRRPTAALRDDPGRWPELREAVAARFPRPHPPGVDRGVRRHRRARRPLCAR